MINTICKSIILALFILILSIFTYNFKNKSSIYAEDIYQCHDVNKIQKIISFFNSKLDTEFTNELSQYICYLSSKYNIKKTIILAVFAQESNFHPYINSKYSSATGIGQIIPRYWTNYLGVTKDCLKNDWKVNAESSVRILKLLKDTWGHLKDWPSFYYSSDKYARISYNNKLHYKIKIIDKMLVSEDIDG